MSVSKVELYSGVAEKTGESKTVVKAVCDTLLDQIIESLSQGEDVRINQFGIFKVKERAARTGRNPRTGEEIQIAACKGVGFTSAKSLKDQINK